MEKWSHIYRVIPLYIIYIQKEKEYIYIGGWRHGELWRHSGWSNGRFGAFWYALVQAWHCGSTIVGQIMYAL